MGGALLFFLRRFFFFAFPFLFSLTSPLFVFWRYCRFLTVSPSLLRWVDFYSKLYTSTGNCSKFSNNIHSVGIMFSQTLFFSATDSDRYFEGVFFLDKGHWAKFSLYSKVVLGGSTYIVDGAQFSSSTEKWSFVFNFNSMLWDCRFSCVTFVTNSFFCLPSCSYSFKSVVWLERELSDFTGLNFENSLDTRRLLLDYFEDKQVQQTHISNDKNYNNNLYDISLAY